MFRLLLGFCLFLEILSNQCLFLTERFDPYPNVDFHPEDTHSNTFQLCGNLSETSCCRQLQDEQIQNRTKMEIKHLFHSNSRNLSVLLFQFSQEINQTMQKLIDFSRNETHFLIRYGYKTFHRSSSALIDFFYDNLGKSPSQTNVDKLFQHFFSLIFEISPAKTDCFWKNAFFSSRVKNFTNHLERTLNHFFDLIELFQLNVELLRTFATEMIEDGDCIQSYIDLFYCHLCSERKEVPCRDSCIQMWEGCLGNVKLMNEIWRKFLDSLENRRFFDEIERDFVSIGYGISEILKDVLSSNANILDQCENLRFKQEFLDLDHEFLHHYNNSLLSSILHSQITSIKQSLAIYKSFWLNFSHPICPPNTNSCWKGRAIPPKLPLLNPNFDKILNKTLQINSQQVFQFNLTDDYPLENDIDYSDYLYEDSIFDSTTTSRTIVEEMSTVSYYDYGDQDVYLDDEFEQTSTSDQPLTLPTSQTPSYHHRRPIIWHINLDEHAENHSTSNQFSSWFALFLFIVYFCTSK